jgi:hypothetical protein
VTIDGGGTLANGAVQGFGVGVAARSGTVGLTDVALTGNGGSGLVVGLLGGAGATVTLDGAASSVSDNGDSGVVVLPNAALTLTGGTPKLPVLRNAGLGLDVRGALSATDVEVGFSLEHGVLVDSAAPVLLTNCDVHDSGHHPSRSLDAQIGVYALRASDATVGLTLDGTLLETCLIHDNSGDGIVLGDPSFQNGVVYGRIRDTVIFANTVGIRIWEKDTGAASTHYQLVATNVYLNRAEGLHLETSFFIRHSVSEIAAITSSNFHNNAREATADCSGQQTAPQVWFQGRAPFPCTSNCTFRPNTFPGDVPTDPVCHAQTTELECLDQTDPQQSADTVAHACAWNQVTGYCDFGYPFSGVCNTGTPNAIYGYTATGLNLPLTVGMFVSGKAAVQGTNDEWLRGGQVNRDFTFDSDPESSASVTSCQPPPLFCP